MFLLENKLQSFYEDIKKLNEVTFKIKDDEEDKKFFEKLQTLKNNSLNTNTCGMTESDTNIFNEKSNPYNIDSEKSEHKRLEINKILIQNPNKSKICNGKNECEPNKNKKINLINSPSGTIVKCGENKKRKASEIKKLEDISNDFNASDFCLVIKSIFCLFYF